MSERDNHGTPVILGNLKRSIDWTEPPAEGDWQTTSTQAGDD